MFGLGGLFDFNGDGKTDSMELGLGLSILHEMEKENRSSNSGRKNRYDDYSHDSYDGDPLYEDVMDG